MTFIFHSQVKSRSQICKLVYNLKSCDSESEEINVFEDGRNELWVMSYKNVC